MAVPAFGAAGTGAASTTGSISVPYPSGITAGQLLIAHIFRFDDGDAAPTTPSGWTAKYSAAGGTSSLHVFTKIAVGTESGSLAFTIGDGTDGFYGQMYRFTGDTADWQFEDGTSATGSSASATMSAVTTTGADRLAINVLAVNNDVTVAAPTGETGGDWVEAVAEFTSTSGTDGTLSLLTANMASAWTITGGTSTLGSSARWITKSFAIYAQASGGASYTLTAAAGSYTATGVAARLAAARKLTSAQGSYALAGQAAGLRRGLRLAASPGGYTLTGIAAALRAARSLAAAQGSYSVTGIDAALTYAPAATAYTLTAETGAYSLTGRAAGLVAKRTLLASPGAYALTGRDAGLTYTPATGAYVLVAETGTYVIAGRDAALRIERSTPDFSTSHGGGDPERNPYDKRALRERERQKLLSIFEEPKRDSRTDQLRREPADSAAEKRQVAAEQAALLLAEQSRLFKQIQQAAERTAASLERDRLNLEREKAGQRAQEQAAFLALEALREDEDAIIALLMAA